MMKLGADKIEMSKDAYFEFERFKVAGVDIIVLNALELEEGEGCEVIFDGKWYKLTEGVRPKFEDIEERAHELLWFDSGGTDGSVQIARGKAGYRIDLCAADHCTDGYVPSDYVLIANGTVLAASLTPQE
jgi:hypothetical protein